MAGIVFYITKTKFLARLQPDKEFRWDYDYLEIGSGGNERFDYGLEDFDNYHSEDDEWTRWWCAQGYKIVYVPESVAMHSHNYTPAQAYKRSFGEARALAAVWNGGREDFNPMRTAES